MNTYRKLLVVVIVGARCAGSASGADWWNEPEVLQPEDIRTLIVSELESRMDAMENLSFDFEVDLARRNPIDDPGQTETAYQDILTASKSGNLRYFSGDCRLELQTAWSSELGGEVIPRYLMATNYRQSEGVSRSSTHSFLDDRMGGVISAEPAKAINELKLNAHIGRLGYPENLCVLPYACEILGGAEAVDNKYRKLDSSSVKFEPVKVSTPDYDLDFDGVIVEGVMSYGYAEDSYEGPYPTRTFRFTFDPARGWLPVRYEVRYRHRHGGWEYSEDAVTASEEVNGLHMPTEIVCIGNKSKNANSFGITRCRLSNIVVGEVSDEALEVAFSEGTEVFDHIAGVNGIANASGGYDPKMIPVPEVRPARGMPRTFLIVNILFIVVVGSILYFRNRMASRTSSPS